MLRYIVVVTFAFVFTSCANRSQNDLIVFKATEEGLEQSNKVISNSTTEYYVRMGKKLHEATNAVIAAIWQPRAMVIKEKTNGIINYLEQVINKLKKEASPKNQNGEMILKEDDMDVVSRLFINQKTGEELYQKLKRYKQDILDVDVELNKQFAENSIIVTSEFELDTIKGKDFANTFFKNIPVIAALAVLSKFENNVRVLENKFVTFCYYKIGSTDGPGFFTKIGFLVSQSTNIIKAGDQMQIAAGVGSFSTVSSPRITINGKAIAIESTEGIASYKFKTPLKAGKYIVPVKIEYTAEDGKRQMVTQKVEYTVVE